MYQSYHLSHKDAQAIIAAVHAEAEKRKQAVSIAVADSHGELIAFLRMDGCRLPPLYIAINKAFTAARERRGSGEVGEASRTAGYPMTNFGDPRYTGWSGGLPVLHEGHVIGAIGVSALTGEEDLELARIGLSAIKP